MPRGKVVAHPQEPNDSHLKSWNGKNRAHCTRLFGGVCDTSHASRTRRGEFQASARVGGRTAWDIGWGGQVGALGGGAEHSNTPMNHGDLQPREKRPPRWEQHPIRTGWFFGARNRSVERSIRSPATSHRRRTQSRSRIGSPDADGGFGSSRTAAPGNEGSGQGADGRASRCGSSDESRRRLGPGAAGISLGRGAATSMLGPVGPLRRKRVGEPMFTGDGIAGDGFFDGGIVWRFRPMLEISSMQGAATPLGRGVNTPPAMGTPGGSAPSGLSTAMPRHARRLHGTWRRTTKHSGTVSR